MEGKRRSESDKTIYKKIHSFEAKANAVVSRLPVFTFDAFERLYIQNRGAVDSVSFAFDEYAKELRAEGRIRTAVSYEAAKTSLDNFKKERSWKCSSLNILRKILRDM